MFDQKKGPGLGLQTFAQPLKLPEMVKVDVHEAARLAGMKDLEQEDGEQEGNEQDGGEQVGEEQAEAGGKSETRESREARAERQRRTRPLCCCGARGCGIGPFTRTIEED